MSDPIRDILEGFESESKFTGNEAYDDLLSESAKQIRQQIGRELLEGNNLITIGDYMTIADTIREVCKLEEE